MAASTGTSPCTPDADGDGTRARDPRPLARIGGGDLPTVTVDPKNENVVYSASVVMWRTEDGGVTWTAVRGAPGGDDYQRIWINPNNPNIIVAVTDQGAVVSANRGESLEQLVHAAHGGDVSRHRPTTRSRIASAAGSRIRARRAWTSRSNDGEITFHDWHPVNIQEYGIAAPDPQESGPGLRQLAHQRDALQPQDRPDDGRRARHDADGPGSATTATCARCRSHWSPVEPERAVLRVERRLEDRSIGGTSWTRISPDLTRQTWEVPANAGQVREHASRRRRRARITALSPSPRDVNVLWAGTDDGNIQVTTDGGATWTNVTPAAIKPWTRIFNIEAGHFDTLTAYAAANTLRLDDMNPHFWRTHDGGKTWTEINTGIAPGAAGPTRSARIPRQKGLLYAATDTQVWVSFDDGDHWQSLRLDMPAISVRDLAGEGRQHLHVRRPGRGHARPRVLDSRQRDAAAAGGG